MEARLGLRDLPADLAAASVPRGRSPKNARSLWLGLPRRAGTGPEPARVGEMHNWLAVKKRLRAHPSGSSRATFPRRG